MVKTYVSICYGIIVLWLDLFLGLGTKYSGDTHLGQNSAIRIFVQACVPASFVEAETDCVVALFRGVVGSSNVLHKIALLRSIGNNGYFSKIDI